MRKLSAWAAWKKFCEEHLGQPDLDTKTLLDEQLEGRAKMRPAMVRGLGPDAELSTTLMIREVENGYVIDVEMPGKPEPMGVVATSPDDETEEPSDAAGMMISRARFCKFVARTGAELLNTVSHLLDEFDRREPNASNRVVGNVDRYNHDKRVVTVSRLKGGYIVDTTQRVKMAITQVPPRLRQMTLLAQSPMRQIPEELEVDETIQEIIVSPMAVLNRLGEFFGVKAE